MKNILQNKFLFFGFGIFLLICVQVVPATAHAWDEDCWWGCDYYEGGYGYYEGGYGYAEGGYGYAEGGYGYYEGGYGGWDDGGGGYYEGGYGYAEGGYGYAEGAYGYAEGYYEGGYGYSEGGYGTATVCWAGCTEVSAEEAANFANTYLGWANAEAGGGGYYDEWGNGGGTVAAPVVSTDEAGRITAIACGNGGYVSVTYHDPVYSQGYYQGYYEGYYQGYYEGYYQGVYVTPYSEGYYQGYYAPVYAEGYYEGGYGYDEGSYAPSGPDLTGTNTTPASAAAGTVSLTGTVYNGGDTGAGSFYSYFEVQGNGTITWTTPAITLGSGVTAPLSVSRSFTAGNYQVRVCVDGFGDVSESNEGNNCSAWKSLSIGGTPPTCTISASPSAAPSTITWSSTLATSCTGGGFSTGNATNGTAYVTGNGTYTLNCTGAGGSCVNSVDIGTCGGATAAPVITATPSRVKSGDTSHIAWSGTGVSGTCTITGPGLSRTGNAASCTLPAASGDVTITSQSTYTITCGAAVSSVTVNLIPTFEEF